VLILFVLLARAARLAGWEPVPAQRLAGVAVALWAVHPALAETMAYVSGRSMGLSSLLLLAGLLAATADRPRRGLAGLAAFAAPLAREMALVAPLLLLAWQITVARPEPLRQALRRAAPVWLGAGLAALVIALMARHRELVAFSLDQRPPLDALRANLFAVPEILRLWVQPGRVSVLPAQPVIHGWADPATLIRLAGLLALPALALALRRRTPLLALAILWALLALVPTNSLIWRVEPVALRPLYLAGIGLSLLLALPLARVRGGAVLAAGLVLWLSAQGWQRATLYQDEVALFADAAAKAPDRGPVQLMLGLALANAGRVEEARAALETALVIDPFLTSAENALRLLDAGPGVYPNLPRW
jgi:tetratricopeptide (TPR) repeat protein